MTTRLRLGLVAGAGVAALLATAPSAAWADQANDNSDTTVVGAGQSDVLGAPLVAPLSAAVGLNLVCPANVNVLSNQRDTGNCVAGDQSNGNASDTTVTPGGQVTGLLGGPIVAPVTAAVGVNVACPINVNVLSNQGNSGNCVPGGQSNSNSGATHVTGGDQSAGVLGGPIVVPITGGLGLNVTCPTDVNVLSNQRDSGACVDSVTPDGGSSPRGDSAPFAGDAPDAPGTPDATGGAQPDASDSTSLPGPPVAGAAALLMRRAPAAPGLGVVPLIAVVAAVAAAAVALRRERWLLLLRR